jgi:hypothetical protein
MTDLKPAARAPLLVLGFAALLVGTAGELHSGNCRKPRIERSTRLRRKPSSQGTATPSCERYRRTCTTA